jgi:hypothetical protein
MKSLFDLLQNYKPPEKSLNPRASLIKEFIDEIDNERVGTAFKKVDPKWIAIKLGVLKTNDELCRFLAECRDYKRSGKSFSQRFFGGFHKQSWK